MPDVLLVQGTALHLPLKDASVHCCVTSPPYYGLRDYGTGTWQGGDPSCTHTRRTSTKEASITTESRPTNTNHEQEGWCGGVCGRCGATRVDEQLGLEPTVEAYLQAMVQVFREVRRVLRPEGTCWINMGDSYTSGGRTSWCPDAKLPIRGREERPPQPPMLKEKNLLGMPWRLALALQADGWILRSEIIWHKLNPMPESVQDRPSRSHEQIFLFSKQARYFYDGEAVREPVQPDPRDALWHTARNGKSMVNHAYDAERGRTDTKTQADGWVRMSNPNGRACRSVWSIPSEPTPFAHFATMPQALVRRCLLAGAPSQVCAACGAPWRREVERQTHAPVYRSTNTPIRYLAASTAGQGTNGTGESTLGMVQHVTTTGLDPTCACAAGVGQAVILDPFCGSGTTLLVARELGHHAVGIDLSYPYLHDIARERLGLTQLAAWEGRNGHPAPAVTYGDLPLFGGA